MARQTLDGCSCFWENPIHPAMPGVGMRPSSIYHSYLTDVGVARQATNVKKKRVAPIYASEGTHVRGCCCEGAWRAVLKSLWHPELSLAVSAVYRRGAADVGYQEVKSNRFEYRDLGLEGATLLLFYNQLKKKPRGRAPRGWVHPMQRPHVCALPLDDRARTVWFPGYYIPKWGLKPEWEGTWQNHRCWRIPYYELATFPVKPYDDARPSDR